MSDHAIDPFAPMTDLLDEIRSGDLSPVDVTGTYLDRIDERDDEINAYVTVTPDLASETAEAAARAIEAGEDPGRLAGLPIALKDLRQLKEGVPHSYGSKLVADLGFVAPRTSADVVRLEEAGAGVLGKTNVPEFGHKGVTDNEHVGPTATPFDTDLNAGGSSGGSAAAVAAGMAPAAIGSDSGGSIRIPAAACGVFGLKPSYGLIPVDSRPNAFGTKTHHTVQGPMTRSVEDAAVLMDVLAGPHPADPASVPVEIDYLDALERPVDDLAVGYTPDLGVFPVAEPVREVVEDAVDDLAAAGATVERIDVDHGLSMDELADAIETTFSTSLVGAAEVLEREFGADLRDYPDQVSDSLLELLAIGDGKSVPDVAATGIPRTELFDAVQATFEEYDLIATPTVATDGMELRSDRGTDWELALTWPFNWTGHPAASVPAGLTDRDRPVGLQLVGRRYEDDAVLAASAALEDERPWIDTYPR